MRVTNNSACHLDWREGKRIKADAGFRQGKEWQKHGGDGSRGRWIQIAFLVDDSSRESC